MGRGAADTDGATTSCGARSPPHGWQTCASFPHPPPGPRSGPRRGDVVVSGEQVRRVVERLDRAQALPHGGLEEGARVDGLLDEVRVEAGAVRRDGRVEV